MLDFLLLLSLFAVIHAIRKIRQQRRINEERNAKWQRFQRKYPGRKKQES